MTRLAQWWLRRRGYVVVSSLNDWALQAHDPGAWDALDRIRARANGAPVLPVPLSDPLAFPGEWGQ